MKVLIVGGARCVWEDIEKSKELFEPDMIFAVNDVGTLLPRLDVWATMHPSKMHQWLKIRIDNGFTIPEFWTASHKIGKFKLNFKYAGSIGGGSGLLAIRIARNFYEAKKIVLAGMPMVHTEGHYFEDKNWKECNRYKSSWEKNKHFSYFTKSLSGWTRELYGYPTKKWLQAEM